MEYSGSCKYEVWLGVCVSLIACAVTGFIKKFKSNYPPGPTGLPIVGYVPFFLSKEPFRDFIQLGKKYGDVFSLRLGSHNVVVLNSTEAIKEGLSKSELLGRPPLNAFNILERESPFFSGENHVWAEHRRFVVQSMKDLGLGKTRIEGQIQDEINIFIETLRRCNGKLVDPLSPLMASIGNNICALVSSDRHEYEDPERKELDANLILTSEVLAQNSSHIFFTWMHYMKFMKFEKARQAYKRTKTIFRKKIKQHEDTLEQLNIRDYIDAYLVEMKHRKLNNPNTTLSDAAFMGSVTDLFGAGTETVKSTLLWCIYILAAYPDVQKRVQKEIKSHLGSEKKAEFTDINQMPYTHAVIMEVMRWKTLTPISMLRYTIGDAIIRGYTIPKGTTIMSNFWAAHHDPEIWPEPDIFKPERFLSEDGHSVLKSPNFIAFSLGKRVCPGEKMARIELFLYLVSIFQNFNVSFPEGFEPTFDAEVTVSYRLNPYQAHFTPRR